MGYGCASFAKNEEEIKNQDENETILVFSPKLVLIGFSPPIKNLPCFLVPCCSFSSLNHVNCYYLNSLNNAHFWSFYNYIQFGMKHGVQLGPKDTMILKDFTSSRIFMMCFSVLVSNK